jgi:ornithine cyclodeaminase/alanine dehydrogenase-like protein (mu-crystallin family)
MRILSADDVDAALDDIALIDRLEALFKAGCETPLRHHHVLPEGTLLLMPAWTARHIGIKLVTVFPGNAKRSLPSVLGQYMLLDGRSGQAVALLDGTMLTKRRTACASGLAARYLAPASATRLLMIGTGALAPHLIRVHARIARRRSPRPTSSPAPRSRRSRWSRATGCARASMSTWWAPTRPRCARATTRRCGGRGSMSILALVR